MGKNKRIKVSIEEEILDYLLTIESDLDKLSRDIDSFVKPLINKMINKEKSN